MRNTLVNMTIKIGKNVTNAYNVITNAFADIKRIYSYIIYSKYKSGSLQYWLIKFTISTEDIYNELDVTLIAKCIEQELRIKSKHKIIGYGQPSLESILTLYEPMINALSIEQYSRWRQIELEDLKQMCRLIIIRLYRNGYYIHKHLVRKAFNNEVLKFLRCEKYKPTCISLEYCKSDDKIKLLEAIPDESEMLEDEEFHNKEALQRVIEMKRDIIIEYIGQRQYDQLIREYSNKSTTAWSRKLVYTIKQYLEKIGISENDFKRYY